MIKNNNFNAQSSYEAPECKTITVLSEGMMCQSYGSDQLDDAIVDEWGDLYWEDKK